jgi:ABC-type Mn2+/Zn2+ transport system permease subunit
MAAARSCMFRAVYWPLIGALIAFVLFAIFMGWLLDRGPTDADGHGHH